MNPAAYQAQMSKAMAAMASETSKLLLAMADALKLDSATVGAFENTCAEFKETCDHLNKQLSVDGRSTSWTPERRMAHGKRVSEAKSQHKPKLYLYSWLDEEPKEIDHKTAAGLLGVTEGSLKVKLSTEGGAIAFYAENRHQVVSRLNEPQACHEALLYEYRKTGNHDDIKRLTKRVKPKR